MASFGAELKNMIARTRRDWLGLLVYGYHIKSEQNWRMFGYQSEEEYKEDLRKSLEKNPMY
ncbi:hypothetical protein [Vibrio nigripulchritudo]|uniref:hypothetical protein n=1 Tax=Vibrio nigripulchritudo TaxID=28173 RepID=UPI0005FA17A8|nr:hypothetical protein [Vibrio nigripulchritudo]KJY79512.1 hypothetical protein TW74_08650 [Vibrio nigripulchritudo]